MRTRKGSATAALTAVLAVAALLAGCGQDGRVLRDPSSALLATTTSTSIQVAAGSAGGTGASGADNPVVVPAGAMILSSPAFADRAAIPAQFTCDGAGTSPPLSWSGVPDGTVELALSVTDPDAGGFVHWVMTGIAPAIRSLDAGAVPEGAIEAVGSSGQAGWSGPCPPKGATHRYVFTLYALDAPSEVAAGTKGTDAIVVVNNQSLGVASLVGTYARP